MIGAGKATVFEVDRDVLIEGKLVPKGKYSQFTFVVRKSWILIFNKSWNHTNLDDYKDVNDALRIPVKGAKSEVFNEKLTFEINADGYVTFYWADKK